MSIESECNDTREKQRKRKLCKAKEAFKKRQFLFRQVMDTNPNILFVLDENEKIIFGNRAFADFYGTTVGELGERTQREGRSTSKK